MHREKSTSLQTVRGRIDAVCDTFESRLRAGERPAIEKCLDDWREPERIVLLRHLLEVEFEFLHETNCAPSRDEYLRRFPDYGDLIDEVLEKSGDETEIFDSWRETEHKDSPGNPVQTFRHGDRFGNYEILEELGRGGMGVVYRARELGPDERVLREVALKAVRADKLAELSAEAEEQFIRRFRDEARAAAGLEDDHVVTVYGVGEIDGRHYYAMRFVDGESLGECVKEGPLENNEAAQFLAAAALGVHAAHEKGILHRDLKPDNIMIEASTRRALVADFGLAKLPDEEVAATKAGDVFGSPPYMSPEQAKSSREVTAVSDVYSLGATFYHLLTGRPPFKAANIAETFRQILDEEPASPRQLNPAVDRDLETICLKCLEKNAASRYASSLELAEDLQRYVQGLPVKARPVGGIGRLKRWCKRNPTLASVGGLALVLLLTLAVGGPLMAFRQAELKKDAKNEAAERLAQKIEADKQRGIATRQADRSRRLTNTILGMFDDTDPLSFLSANRGSGDKLTPRKILQRGAARVNEELDADSDSKAELQITIGRAFRSLGDLKNAQTYLVAAYRYWNSHRGRNPRLLAQSASSLAWLYHDRGEYIKAEALYKQAMELYSAGDAKDESRLNDVRFHLGWMYAEYFTFDEAERLLKTALQSERQRSSGVSQRVATLQLALTGLSFQQEQRTQALAELTEATRSLAVLKSKAPLIDALVTALHGMLLAWTTGRNSIAVDALHKARETAKTQLGDTHIYLAALEYHLAVLHVEDGNDDAAERYFDACEKMIDRLNVWSHPRVGNFVKSYGTFLVRKRKRPKQADALCAKFLAATQKAFPADHPLQGLALAHVAYVRFKQRSYRRAAEGFQRALDLTKGSSVLKQSDRSGVLHLQALSQELWKGPGEDVWRRYRIAIERLTAVIPNSPAVPNAKMNLAFSLMDGHRYTDEVGQLLAQTLKRLRPNRPFGALKLVLSGKAEFDWDLNRAFNLLNMYHVGRGELTDAARFAEQRLAVAPKHVESQLRAASDLAQCIAFVQRKPASAKRYQRLVPRWRARAIELLRQAKRSGCSASRIRRWKSFRCLVNDDAYRRLVGLRTQRKAVAAPRPRRRRK